MTRNDWLVTALMMYPPMLAYLATNAATIGVSAQLVGLLGVLGVGVAVILNRLDTIGASVTSLKSAPDVVVPEPAPPIPRPIGPATAPLPELVTVTGEPLGGESP